MILAPSPTSHSSDVRPRTTAELDQELRVLRAQLDALEREMQAVPVPSAPREAVSDAPSAATRLERRAARVRRRANAEQHRSRGLENLLRAGLHHLR